MRINFDEIGLKQSSKRVSTNQSPIKIQIQSPIYNQVIRQLSPHNYKAEITSMNSVISLPQEISHFIAEQIEKQLDQSISSEVESPSYFFSKTKSLANINKDLMETNSTTMFKQSLNLTKHSKKQNNKNTKKVHINYKKHTCNDHIPTSVRQALKQCEQLTYAPRLYQNEISQRVDFNRKVHAYVTNSNKNSNVYESLYQQASQRRMKTQLSKQYVQQSRPERKPKINNNYHSKNNKQYIPLHNRLNQILYRRVDRIKQQQSLDITSGRQLFKPALKNSKDSYKIYLKSLSKEKIENNRTKTKKSIRFIDIKQQQIIKTNNSKKLTQQLTQSKVKQSPIDVKTVEYFTQIFYPNNPTDAPSMSMTSQNTIKKPQFMVLHAFLHQIEQLQSKRYEQETTVSSSRMGMSAAASKIERVLSKEDFQQKLKKYYQGLNLQDRQILREQIWKQNKMKHKQRDEQTNHHHVSTFRPSINVLSSSLDNLARGHLHQIYYV